MMSRQKDGHPDLSDDDVCVSLMADLQEEQQTESDKMIEDMAEKVRRPYHALGSLDVVVCMVPFWKPQWWTDTLFDCATILKWRW